MFSQEDLLACLEICFMAMCIIVYIYMLNTTTHITLVLYSFNEHNLKGIMHHIALFKPILEHIGVPVSSVYMFTFIKT